MAVLLLVNSISARPIRATLIGVAVALTAAIAAAIQAIQTEQPVGLGVGRCGVAGLALLLLPVLDAEVPTHVVEAAALLLLGTAGAIALASATDLYKRSSASKRWP